MYANAERTRERRRGRASAGEGAEGARAPATARARVYLALNVACKNTVVGGRSRLTRPYFPLYPFRQNIREQWKNA